MNRTKLGLGTVQFGMPYGVSNRQGQTAPGEVRAILEAAAERGIRVLDTAVIYGESEEVLGSQLPRSHGFDIVTKVPSLLREDGTFDPASADRMLERSLSRLRQPSVYGLLLHRAGDLLSPRSGEVMEWLLECRRRGRVEKVGVSVYAEDDVAGLTERYPIQLLQAPVNIFDQRLVRSGALAACKARGVEVHARSVFLQGLLLMNEEEVPAYFRPYAPHLEGYRLFLRRRGIDPVEAALTYVNGLSEVDTIVCGVNDRAQLLQLVRALDGGGGGRATDFAPFAAHDPGLLNPSQWKL
ncbi:aryl-alcohol dehydrogenase [Cohnella sp. CFH 77786]|uniref:aldo/keto reductase n=1 Tax=Cohnella sp. CFH 77786 TaxID=2662265 RepID=UPI001C60A9AC|nr:aldo/keto reductase [Cohnella sp. CFH 77786]MBW5448355.1 aryl-alcohol dehydrogenase [Cohnella sp. CFH 77786]